MNNRFFILLPLISFVFINASDRFNKIKQMSSARLVVVPERTIVPNSTSDVTSQPSPRGSKKNHRPNHPKKPPTFKGILIIQGIPINRNSHTKIETVEEKSEHIDFLSMEGEVVRSQVNQEQAAQIEAAKEVLALNKPLSELREQIEQREEESFETIHTSPTPSTETHAAQDEEITNSAVTPPLNSAVPVIYKPTHVEEAIIHTSTQEESDHMDFFSMGGQVVRSKIQQAQSAQIEAAKEVLALNKPLSELREQIEQREEESFKTTLTGPTPSTETHAAQDVGITNSAVTSPLFISTNSTESVICKPIIQPTDVVTSEDTSAEDFVHVPKPNDMTASQRLPVQQQPSNSGWAKWLTFGLLDNKK